VHIKDRLTGFRRTLADRITAGWQGDEAEAEMMKHKRSRLAPQFVLLYALVVTFFSFDMVMSLLPTWFSTLFGAYYFMGGWCRGPRDHDRDPATVTASGRSRSPSSTTTGSSCSPSCLLGVPDVLPVPRGLVRNLPLETQFIAIRRFPMWTWLSIAVGCCLFLIPFWGLITRAAKMNPITHALFAGVILLGIFLERFDLVVPSLNPKPESFPFGAPELAITVGFLSLFILCYIAFMRTFPIVPLTGLPKHAEHVSGNV
jgi:hypothetical protein